MTRPANHITTRWIDHGRDPRQPPNPGYPLGVDLDLRPDNHDGPSCKTALDYPAMRCGAYKLTCEKCGVRVMVTTAGRSDDPRSVILPCHGEGYDDGQR